MYLYSFLTENNQTITRSKRNARQFGHRYWRSGNKVKDNELGIYHIYRTHIDDEGNRKIKRIKKEIPKQQDKKD
jgi:hypothetical protein